MTHNNKIKPKFAHKPFQKKKQAKDILAVYDEEIYVLSEYSGINPIYVFTDGIDYYRFDGEETVYFKVEDVKDWYVKELKIAVKPELIKHYKEMIEASDRILSNENN